MKKRLLSMALCLCMVLTLLPTMALAVSGERSIQLGSSAFQGSQNEAIYFGSYAQSAYTPTAEPEDPRSEERRVGKEC